MFFFFLFSFYDLYLVHIESTGALPPDVLFVESVKILSQKCRTFLAELENEL